MDNKEQIINEYLIGGISFRSLAKKYGVSRSTINRWVLEYPSGAGLRLVPALLLLSCINLLSKHWIFFLITQD
jgi:transposase-like protein